MSRRVLAVGFLLLVLSVGCDYGDVVTESYATLAEAEKAGAIARGWIPPGLPPSSYELREAHNADTNRRWGLFNFAPSEGAALRQRLQPEEVSVAGMRCDIPHRIEWWPVLLRGSLDSDHVKASGLQAFRHRDENLIVLVNWQQGRAYYWDR
jgi:hypothetical protein